MADTLYLSLWYLNLRLPQLADKLTAVLGAFAAHDGEPRVYSATVWPIDWTESPVFQQDHPEEYARQQRERALAMQRAAQTFAGILGLIAR
jgi:hypothetical protein